MGMALAEKVFLAKVAKFSADLAGDGKMIVDDQADVGSFCNGKNRLCHAANFFEGRIFRAELDQISATVAKLLRDEVGRSAIQIGGVHESVEPAIGERFHRVWVNMVCQSQLERRRNAANGPLKAGANIIH